ncbi:MAG TPA: alpha/beta fold hydrolase [Burkholderiales bacterium]|nr:alpha/beta fold hydrolase [Burkholderiales bacterium]
MRGLEVEHQTIEGEVALELLACPVDGTPPPLLFVHGAYVGAWCWAEHWLPWFAMQGHPAYALSLRAHGRSAGRARLNDFGLSDYADDLLAAIARLGRAPILIGHSMGALVVQKALERGIDCRAAVLICPVPPFGLLPATFSLAFTRPALFAQIQAMAAGHRVSLDALQQAMFSGPLEVDRLRRIYARMQPESSRALLDMSGWGLPQPWRAARVPTLVLGAGRDVLIPAALAGSSARMLGAEYRLLEDLAHAVMLEAGWQGAARAVLDWLEARLDAAPRTASGR